MLPPRLDDYVPAEAAVRFIVAYAKSLDGKALGLCPQIGQGHRTPVYHPATLLKELQDKGQTEVSLTDADARKMRETQRGGYFIGYNVQLAVDAKHDLIAAEEVVQSASDRAELGAIAMAAKTELNVTSLEVVADKGCHSADQLEACEAANITTYVPAQGSTSGRSKDGTAVFGKERFSYDAAADEYQCPGDMRLKLRGKCRSRDKTLLQYANAAACRGCPLKARCTTGAYRTLKQWSHGDF